MKKVISLFLAVVCMISIFSTMTFTASAATANAKVSEVSKVTIQNVGTGQYLNFDYGTLSNGTYVRVWPCDGSTEQLWSIDHVSGSTYRILTYKSSKYCLDIYRGYSKLKSGQKCDIWKTADDTVAQNLTFYRCDDGSYILRMPITPTSHLPRPHPRTVLSSQLLTHLLNPRSGSLRMPRETRSTLQRIPSPHRLPLASPVLHIRRRVLYIP